MSDFLMEFLGTYPGIFLSDLSRYLLAAVPAAILIFVIKPHRLMLRKLQDRPQTRQGMSREIRYSILTAAIFALNGYGVFLGIQHDVLKLYDDPAQHGWVWFALSFPLILVVHDAYFYWTHRAMHHPKLFRYFHRTHHKSHTPSPWAAYAFDPGEAWIQAIFLPLYLLVVPTTSIVVVVFLIFMITRNVMGHTGYELHPRWWMSNPLTRFNNTTAHHDLHHETAHWNYGLYFTWWDRLMGTEHPDYKQRFDEAWANTPPKKSRNRKSVAATLGAIVVAGLLLSDQVKAEQPDGLADVWVTPGFGSLVEIAPCEDDKNLLCGTIVWLKEDAETDGSPKRDSRNPDPAMRNNTLVGTALLTGFKWGVPPLKGSIYNPEDGRTYRATINAPQGDNLEISGCVLVICQTQHWQRAAPLIARLNQISLK
ncbi:MAG: sterol desaturase family protein [Paracoccaceae bacterium]